LNLTFKAFDLKFGSKQFRLKNRKKFGQTSIHGELIYNDIEKSCAQN